MAQARNKVIKDEPMGTCSESSLQELIPQYALQGQALLTFPIRGEAVLFIEEEHRDKGGEN